MPAVARRWVPRAPSRVVVRGPCRPRPLPYRRSRRAGLADAPILHDEVTHVHGDKPIHIAHEGREALPGALAVGLPLGVGQPLQHGRSPLLLLPFLLEPLLLGGLPLPLLLLVLYLLRLARQLRQRRPPDSRGRRRSAASGNRSVGPAAGA